MLCRLHERLRNSLGRRGFSLVEILMVLLILTVGILPLTIIQHRARREVTESDHYTQAITVAQAQMERVKGLGFGNAAADSGLVGIVSWRCNVANISPGLERIQVSATWESEGQPQVLTLADLVSLR